MYGLFGGVLQALALTGSAGIPAGEFMPLLMSWLQAMQGGLPKWAEQIDAGDHTSNVVSNLGMQAEAYVNLIDAGKAAGTSTELMLPMQSLMPDYRPAQENSLPLAQADGATALVPASAGRDGMPTRNIILWAVLLLAALALGVMAWVLLKQNASPPQQ